MLAGRNFLQIQALRLCFARLLIVVRGKISKSLNSGAEEDSGVRPDAPRRRDGFSSRSKAPYPSRKSFCFPP